ncbi:hypothetical protein [Actinoplanes sp. NBRC 101535]|uniref:hypothetical protein n=1 Tax=Actinoplanes sp. NBRC 101535 TaxID=3032196 RepID=UPI0024A38CB1|nr:hypothetical protein [Actinoplanes sp. NBRC 101535]GLY07056.1 hypothetical protein Acsp01_74350 [Actinoplanes sp. NBRC 101535]
MWSAVFSLAASGASAVIAVVAAALSWRAVKNQEQSRVVVTFTDENDQEQEMSKPARTTKNGADGPVTRPRRPRP